MLLRSRVGLPLLLLASLGACATLQQFVALRQVDFSLAGVGNGRLAGVALTRIATYQDLSATEIGRIALAVATDNLPLEFRADIRAENPAENRTTASMVRLAWTLLLDDRETIHGVLDTTWTLPPGQAVTIPLQLRLNLMEFFSGSAESLLNLAAGIAGLRADPTRITLRAVPSIDTPLGPITYPTPITIVSRTVGGDGAR
jgi:hypothetical protein